MMPIMKMFVGVRKKGKKNIVLCDMLEGMFTNTWPCLLGGFTQGGLLQVPSPKNLGPKIPLTDLTFNLKIRYLT